MIRTPTSISSPALRKQWRKAKGAARKSAEALDRRNHSRAQTTAITNLERKVFRKDLGPNLDRWVKAYPNWKKMCGYRSKIDAALTAYDRSVRRASLDSKIEKPLLAELHSISDLQQKRAREAEALIASDLDLALKASKKRTPPPILVFKHRDIGRAVSAKAGTLKHLELAGKPMAIEVIIGDAKLLSRFPEGKDYNNAAQKIKDAGDFRKLVSDIAAALKQADRNVGAGRSLSSENRAFAKKIDKAIEQSVDRATREAGRLGKLRGNARWANVKRAGSLVLSFSGAAAGVAGLALTPFTFSVATVAGCIGLAKSSVEIAQQLADYASTCEMMANGIAKDLYTLRKHYGKWLSSPEVRKAGGVSNKVGMAELAKRGVNALAPALVTNLKTVKGDIGTYGEKIDNLEVQSDRTAEQISKWLHRQRDADRAFKELQKLGRDVLTDKEMKMLLAAMGSLDKSAKVVESLIKKTTDMNRRVARNHRDANKLIAQFKRINVKNPLWSDLGSAVFELTSSVGYAIAGNINAPDPYRFARPAMDIVSAIDIARDQLQNAHNFGVNLRDSFEERKARIRA